MVKVSQKEADTISTIPSDDLFLSCLEPELVSLSTILCDIWRPQLPKINKQPPQAICSRKWSSGETDYFY